MMVLPRSGRQIKSRGTTHHLDRRSDRSPGGWLQRDRDCECRSRPRKTGLPGQQRTLENDRL